MIPGVQLPSSRMPVAQGQTLAGPRSLQPQSMTPETQTQTQTQTHHQNRHQSTFPEGVQSKSTHEEKDAIPTLNLSKFSSVSLDLDVSQLKQDPAVVSSNRNLDLTNPSSAEAAERTKPEVPTVGERQETSSSSETRGEGSASDLKRARPESDNELGSDLDDSDDDIKEGEDESINDLILCQYEKISRVRTRWRGVLRAGIIHIGHSDYCFSRANADLDW